MKISKNFSRQDALDWDAGDPLRDLRNRFALADGLIYLDGNSLGALPKATMSRLQTVICDQWGGSLIRGWNDHDWIHWPKQIGNRLAGLIGAQDDSVLIADSTSINLFKAAGAALKHQAPRKILISEQGNFPTDLYMLQGLADYTGGGATLHSMPRDEIIGALNDQVAALVLTQVDYKTGAVHDMAAMTKAAHDHGALVIWDLSHSAGALPIDLAGDQVDLAVGCGYKFLNGGPGAPGFIYVAPRHQDWFQSPLTGWMGHQLPFNFSPNYVPARGIANAQCGTPGILGMAALEEGISTFDGLDMRVLRQKSQNLGDLFLHLVRQFCVPAGLEIACPEMSDRRGSQVSLRHADGYAIVQALIARNVIGDFRSPDILRFGLTPLYTRYVDVFDAVGHLADIMGQGIYRQPQFAQRRLVT
jgi:kynureninase